MVQQCQHQKQSLLLAARQGGERRFTVRAEAESFEQLTSRPASGFSRPFEQLHRFGYPHPIRQSGLLELAADKPAQALTIRSWIQPQHSNAAGVRTA